MAVIKGGMLVLGLALCVGCGDRGRAPVQGRVTFEGEIVTEGVVYFVPESGPSASGMISEEGTYQLSTHSAGDGAIVGPHQVYLSGPPTDLGNYTLDDYAANKAPEDQARPAFPQKYLSPQTSGLRFEVKPGSNVIDLALEK